MVDRIIIFYGSRRDFEEIVEQETEDFEEVIPFMELIQHYNARLRPNESGVGEDGLYHRIDVEAYTKYSNGTYINAGQNLIFETEMSQSEIIRQLKTHNANDTLEYDFFEKNNEYFLKVKGIKRLFFNGILTSTFKVEFGGNTQKYIIIHRCNNFQLLYSSGYEAEIFEFMVKKLNCVPQKEVKEI